MSIVPVHVFTAGIVGGTHQDARRFNISLDGHKPSTVGWSKVMDFNVYNAQVDDTFPVYVAEDGPTGKTNPHRFLVDRSPGARRGWRDLFTFYAFAQPAPGTIPYYVMNAGGVSELDRQRSEISTNPVPLPGWYLSFIFHAYPSGLKTPPQMTIHVSQAHHPHRFRVAKDASNPGGWSDAFKFLAYSTAERNTFPIYVSQAGDNDAAGPFRYRVGKDGYGAEVGWTKDYVSYGLNYPAPGAVPIYVMDAGGQKPGDWHRCKLSLTDNAKITGWTNRFTFFAYPVFS